MLDLHPFILSGDLGQDDATFDIGDDRSGCIGLCAHIGALLGIDDDRVSLGDERRMDVTGVILIVGDLQPVSFLALHLEWISLKEFRYLSKSFHRDNYKW